MVVLQVVDVYFPKHPVTNQRQAFCFVTFSTRKVTTKHQTDATYHAFIPSVLLLPPLLVSLLLVLEPLKLQRNIWLQLLQPIKQSKAKHVDACRLQMLLFRRATARLTVS